PGGICIDASLEATNAATAAAEIAGAAKPPGAGKAPKIISTAKKVASVTSDKVISGVDGIIFGIGGVIQQIANKGMPETPVRGKSSVNVGGALIVNYANHTVAAIVGDATPT